MMETLRLPEGYPVARHGRHRRTRRIPRPRMPRFLARMIESRRQRLDQEADRMLGDVRELDWADERTWEWHEVGLKM